MADTEIKRSVRTETKITVTISNDDVRSTLLSAAIEAGWLPSGVQAKDVRITDSYGDSFSGEIALEWTKVEQS